MRDDLRATEGLAALTDPADSPRDAWYLVVTMIGGGSSRVVTLHEGQAVVFGRLPGSDLVLDHDAVSRTHAQIRRSGSAVLVEDLGSRNGTFVNGTPISGPRRLSVGDEITIGPATAILATTTAMRRRVHVGSLTDLEDRLGSEVDRAQRYHRTLGLVMVRFEGPAEAVGQRLEALASELRRMDFLAEYGPDELAIVLPEADRNATLAVATRLAAAPAPLAAHVGVACYPVDGTQPGELIHVARASLRSARTGRKPGAAEPHPDGAALPGMQVVIVDPVMRQVFTLARQCAASNINVLVVGETGSGKEVVSEAVHRFSARAAQPYVRLNCASLPESLLEAELFGYEKGAFTGAVRQKPGYFEAASAGTIFLDEIGELPLSAQAKLLRAIETKRVTRVGGTREIAVDVRLVCATNRDLEAEIKRGRFRQDLYFRIGAFVIPVPPLRDRRSEIEPLARQFVRELCGEIGARVVDLTAEALDALARYDWPGNVRELRNAIERAVVLSAGGATIEVAHLPDRVREPAPGRAPAGASAAGPSAADLSHGLAAGTVDVRRRVADVEREAVVAALAESGGNQTHAAKRLGLSRFALIRLMDKHGLRQR